MKKKSLAVFLVGSMLCSSMVSFASAVEDGRGNLPKEFTVGKVQSVESSENYVSVIKEDGYFWLSGSYGDSFYAPFTKVCDGVAAVSEGTNIFDILKTDGTLWSADIKDAGNFSAYTKLLDDVRSIEASGADIHLAVRSDNTLWGWGTDVTRTCFPIDEDSLPSSSIDKGLWNTTVLKPTKMLEHVQKVQAAGSVTMFLKTDGSLWTMGSNDLGELGNGSALDTTESVPVRIMDDVKDISADGSTRFAIKDDGSLWAWGRMPWVVTGESQDIRATPFRVADNVKTVDECGRAIIYVTNDGQMWSLGDNHVNCGARNDIHADSSRDVPFKTTLTDVQSLGCSINAAHGLAVKTDGSLWAWGDAGTRIASIDNPPFYDLYNHSDYGDGIYNFLQLAGPSAVATPEPTTATAKPTSASVLVNGKQIAFDAYEIGGNNYFKLRDIASVLSGTEKQFEVSWDGSVSAITLTPGQSYTSVGGELAQGAAKQQTAKLSTDKVYMDGAVVSLSAYNIANNNYFKLRDLGKLFDFGVTWDGTAKSISINTTSTYTE